MYICRHFYIIITCIIVQSLMDDDYDDFLNTLICFNLLHFFEHVQRYHRLKAL